MIKGLTYLPEFISKEEEKNLIEFIDSQQWNTDLKRRTQHYGYKYDYTKKKIDKDSYVGKIPKEFDFIIEKLEFNPDQMIVNEYQPGQGISRHTDCIPCFKETIASLSLGSICAMEFENKKGKKGSILLEPRSLLVLNGEVRYDWMHSIPARKEDIWENETIIRERRISLTFRNVILSS